MFSFPQPTNDSTSPPFDSTSTNEVDIPETYSQITTLLTLIYPTPTSLSILLPPTTSLQALSHLLAISQKYVITLATEKLTSVLLERAKENPSGDAMKVYAIGCWCDVPELISGASEECMKVGFVDLLGGGNPSTLEFGEVGEIPDSDEDTDVESDPDILPGNDLVESKHSIASFFTKEGTSEELLRRISAWDYHRLLRLHIQRSVAIKSLFLTSSLPSTPQALRIDPPPCPQCSSTAHFGLSLPAKWFIHFQAEVPGLIDKHGPQTGVIFGEEFMSVCVKNGCARCGSSLMSKEGREFLKKMKERIDTFPGRI